MLTTQSQRLLLLSHNRILQVGLYNKFSGWSRISLGD